MELNLNCVLAKNPVIYDDWEITINCDKLQEIMNSLFSVFNWSLPWLFLTRKRKKEKGDDDTWNLKVFDIISIHFV